MNDSKQAITAEKYNRLIVQAKCPIKDEECVICYEVLYNKSVIYLPCKHFFHYSCFKKVIETKNYTCPFCRFDFKTALRKTGFRFQTGYQIIETYLNAVDANVAPDLLNLLYWDMVNYYSANNALALATNLAAAEAAVLVEAEAEAIADAEAAAIADAEAVDALAEAAAQAAEADAAHEADAAVEATDEAEADEATDEADAADEAEAEADAAFEAEADAAFEAFAFDEAAQTAAELPPLIDDSDSDDEYTFVSPGYFIYYYVL